jgi:hypothetical protein
MIATTSFLFKTEHQGMFPGTSQRPTKRCEGGRFEVAFLPQSRFQKATVAVLFRRV